MTDEKAQWPTDYQAIRIVGLIGEAHRGETPSGPERAELIRDLARLLDTTDVPCPSDDEAAAAALELLAKDPRFAGPVKAARNGPQASALGFGVVESTFLIAGLIVALQTAIDFERDKDGRWSIKIKKKATSDALLKPLVKKLLALLGPSGSAG
jgi:hypothetical protein